MKIEELELLSSKISNINLLNSIVETFDNVSYEVRTRLLEELKKCDYNVKACSIAIDKDVLYNRTLEEQIKLMEELKKSDYNKYVYKIAIDYDILKNKNIEEQLNLMRDFIKKGKVSHNDNLQKIQNIKEYKKYLKKLKKELGKDADVRLDTMVPEFNPNKKIYANKKK